MRPSDILASTRLQHAGKTEKEVFEIFFASVETDSDALRVMAQEWFRINFKRDALVMVSANEYELRAVEQPACPPIFAGSKPAASRPPLVAVASEQRAWERAQVTAWKEQVRTKLAMTMRFVLPDGSELQRAQVGYARTVSSVLAELLRGLPDNVIVGAHRTEADLQNVLKRYLAPTQRQVAEAKLEMALNKI